MSTRQPKDGDLVEVFLTRDAAVKLEQRFRGQTETVPDHVRGRVYAKGRGLDFAVALFTPVRGWETVSINGADSLHVKDGERVRYLTLEDLTLEEQLRFAFSDSHDRRLRAFELSGDRRYERPSSGEGIGWKWQDGDEGLSLTIYVQTHYADEPHTAVVVNRETDGYPDYERLDTYSVEVIRKDYAGHWTSRDAYAFERNGLTPRDAVVYARRVVNALAELLGDAESKAAEYQRKVDKQTALDMLQPYLKAFFKEHGETPGV